MNKELKIYIKQNLKQEKKKDKKKLSLKEILLFPLTLLITPFSNKIKKNDLIEEECNIYEEDNSKNIRKESYSNLVKSLNKNIYYEDYISTFPNEKEISNIDDFIKENNQYNDFQTTLFKMIDERNLIDSDVYNKVHIDRRLFSKIRNDRNYHPSKETILLLGLSMELTEEEIEKLLDSASYSLPRNNHYDLIIRFCFMKGIYKLTDVNDLLDQYDCKLFNY